MPMRMSMLCETGGSLLRMARLLRMISAACTASDGSPNSSMMPSPKRLTTRPDRLLPTYSSMASTNRSHRRTVPSSSLAISRTESTTSAKTTVLVERCRICLAEFPAARVDIVPAMRGTPQINYSVNHTAIIHEYGEILHRVCEGHKNQKNCQTHARKSAQNVCAVRKVTENQRLHTHLGITKYA